MANGDKLYHGSTCTGCHGADAKGTPLGPNLTGPAYLWGDGSVAALEKTITEGVAQPKQFRSGMPAKGGGALSGADVHDLAAYLWALGHRSQ